MVSVANHLTGEKKTGDLVEDLPEHLIGSNVIAFTLDNGAELIIRPSGTEPKIKVYIMVKVDSMEKAEEIKSSLSAAVKALAE